MKWLGRGETEFLTPPARPLVPSPVLVSPIVRDTMTPDINIPNPDPELIPTHLPAPDGRTFAEIVERVRVAEDERQEFFHGTFKNDPILHLGQTFADNEDTARNYGGSRGKLFNGTVDLKGLRIAHVKPFDRDDANYGAIGDRESEILWLQQQGVDLIVFDDEDPHNRQHESWRIVSPKALARFQASVRLVNDEDED